MVITFVASYLRHLEPLVGCSPEDKAVLEAVLERMLESERVEIQTIRAGQNGERKARAGLMIASMPQVLKKNPARLLPRGQIFLEAGYLRLLHQSSTSCFTLSLA